MSTSSSDGNGSDKPSMLLDAFCGVIKQSVEIGVWLMVAFSVVAGVAFCTE